MCAAVRVYPCPTRVTQLPYVPVRMHLLPGRPGLHGVVDTVAVNVFRHVFYREVCPKTL